MKQSTKEKKRRGKELAKAIEEKTGYFFHKIDCLEKALTHPSLSTKEEFSHYERLEFLGDRVLGFVVVSMLFELFPQASEGELSLRFNSLVNAVTLSEIATEIGLPELIKAGSEMGPLSGQKRTNIRADALESFIGALYLDGGIKAVEVFIYRFWLERAKRIDSCRRDPKTYLQEWAHRAHACKPIYTIHECGGPDHDPIFTIKLSVEGLEAIFAQGSTRKKAEQDAAKALLIRECVWELET